MAGTAQCTLRDSALKTVAVFRIEHGEMIAGAEQAFFALYDVEADIKAGVLGHGGGPRIDSVHLQKLKKDSVSIGSTGPNHPLAAAPALVHKDSMKTQRPTSFSPDARFLLGISQLSLSLASEVTDTVGDMHGAIRRSTPLGLLPEHTGIAHRVYALLGKSFKAPAHLLGAIGRHVSHRDVDTMTLNVQAAINGVFGDLLIGQDNPLAFSMSLHGDTPQADKPLLLFVHGLCLHDRSWHKPAHLAFAESLRAQGFSVSYLRYNSGLPIAENGRLLADLLESVRAQRMVLVGHSMGGLISRSALHQAGELNHRCVDKISHLAAIGSPHHGADAERIGNYANRLLTLSRWSAPLTRLGNLRSAAIHDLRFGSLLHSDRDRAGHVLHTHDPREPIAVPDHVAHYFVGATRSKDNSEKKLRSDLLVTPKSALAEDYLGTDAVQRDLHYGIDHMQLMWDAEVYVRLGRWLGIT